MLRGHFVLLLSLGLPLSSVAQTARVEPTPTAEVSKFVMGTRLGYITCSEKYKSYLEKWELYSLVTEGQRAPQGTPPTDADVADCIHQTCAARQCAVQGRPQERRVTQGESRLQRIHGGLGWSSEVHPQAGSRDRPAVPCAPEAG